MKFNLEKTKILPIGNTVHCNHILNMRILGAYHIKSEKIIIKDGQPMETLGVWIGNDIKITDQWHTIIEKQF